MNGALSPRDVADRFYAAFADRDFAVMGALYDDTATFTDPAFGALDARRTRAMWAMLLSRSKDLSVTHEIQASDDERVRTQWVAHYTFGRTGRKVNNHVTATMDVRDGKIIRHVDDFDMQSWMKQALGWPGILLGWLPSFRNRIKAGAQAQLATFMQKENGA